MLFPLKKKNAVLKLAGSADRRLSKCVRNQVHGKRILIDKKGLPWKAGTRLEIRVTLGDCSLMEEWYGMQDTHTWDSGLDSAALGVGADARPGGEFSLREGVCRSLVAYHQQCVGPGQDRGRTLGGGESPIQYSQNGVQYVSHAAGTGPTARLAAALGGRQKRAADARGRRWQAPTMPHESRSAAISQSTSQ